MNKLTVFLGTIIIVLLFTLNKSCQKVEEMADVAYSFHDTLEVTRTENGAETASIQVIQMQNERMFLQIQTRDSVIKKLQSVVKDYKGRLNSALVLSNFTTSIGVTETIIKWDTLLAGTKVYPMYTTQWNERWESGVITATRDSIYRDIKVKNEYEIILGSESNGWFKKKEYNVQVTNLNPNTYTRELRSFQVKATPKRFGVGLQMGYGLNLTTLKPVPYIGIGINFNLFSIK